MSRRLAFAVFSVALILLTFCTFFGIALFLSSNSQNGTQETRVLQIFLDQNLSIPYRGQSPIHWGILRPGIVNFTIWLKNNGSIPLQYLSLIPPLFPANITLSWDCENCTLVPYETKQATLTFSVPPSSDAKNIFCLFGGRFYIAYFKKSDLN
jgi:hypothetical protein